MDLIEAKLALSAETQTAIRTILKSYFHGRDLDELAKKAHPIMSLIKIQSILFEDAEFNKYDVIFLVGLDMEVTGYKNIKIGETHIVMLEKIKDLLVNQNSTFTSKPDSVPVDKKYLH